MSKSLPSAAGGRKSLGQTRKTAAEIGLKQTNSPDPNCRWKSSERLYPNLEDEICTESSSDDETDDQHPYLTDDGGATSRRRRKGNDSTNQRIPEGTSLTRKPIHELEDGSGPLAKLSSWLKMQQSNLSLLNGRQRCRYILVALASFLLAMLSWDPILLMSLIRSLSLGGGVGSGTGAGPSFVRHLPDAMRIFRTEVNQLRINKYSKSSLTQKDWATVLSATKLVLDSPDPTAPAVIIVAGPDSKTVECLLHDLSRAAGKAISAAANEKNRLVIRSDPTLTKLGLDKKLGQDLERLTRLNFGNSAVAVLESVQKLTGNAALSLHAYADNDNAPFKSILLFLSVLIEDVIRTGSSCEAIVEDALADAWHDISVDKRSALMSRINNAPICVKSVSDDIEC